MPLHKPYKDDGAGGWVPQALSKEITNVSEVVKLLNLKESKEAGVPASYFHEQGWCSLPAIATELRARGYKIKVFLDPNDEENIMLIEMPAAGAKRRKKDQMSLLGAIQPDSPLGPNG
jgi:hypothetical protein